MRNYREVRLGHRPGLDINGLLARLDSPVVGLVYHIASDVAVPHVKNLYSYPTLTQFISDMEYLCENFSLLSATDAQLLERSSPLGRKRVVLTVDDGMAECFELIRPVLLRMGIPATFFLCSSFVDNKNLFYRHKVSLCLDRLRDASVSMKRGVAEFYREHQPFYGDNRDVAQWMLDLDYNSSVVLNGLCQILEIDESTYLKENSPYLNREQLKTMVREGFTLGGHGSSHFQLNGHSPPEVIREEVAVSCSLASEISGVSPVFFAFPFYGRTIDRGLLGTLVHEGIAAGFMDTGGLRADESFVLNRISAESSNRTATCAQTLEEKIFAEASREINARRRISRYPESAESM